MCILMDDSTFASRKSSLRAFIWCIYLHFTKNITYALLVLTPRNTLPFSLVSASLFFSKEINTFIQQRSNKLVKTDSKNIYNIRRFLFQIIVVFLNFLFTVFTALVVFWFVFPQREDKFVQKCMNEPLILKSSWSTDIYYCHGAHTREEQEQEQEHGDEDINSNNSI